MYVSNSQKHFGLRCQLFHLGSIVPDARTRKSTERRSRSNCPGREPRCRGEATGDQPEQLPILTQHYFDRDVAQNTADALLAREKSGDDDAAADGEAFAGLLSSQMRTASHDMHLIVEFSQRPLPTGPPVQTTESLARFRNAMLQQNCMIRKVEILPYDIGYLKLDFFPDTSVCGSALKTAMASLNRADATHL